MAEKMNICAKLPWEMAQASTRVAAARDLVFDALASLTDETLRAHVVALLLAVGGEDERLQVQRRDDLAPPRILLTDAAMQARSGKESQQLVIAKLTAPLPYDPTWAAPGANLQSHHCYPGGWVLHTALDLQPLLDLTAQAERIKTARLNKDALIAAIILHDWAKLKLMTWNAEHELDAEQGIGHHVTVIAEAMLRQMPAAVIRLLAGVHSGWWVKPAGVRNAIEGAARWVDVDPWERGYLWADRDDLSLESWVVHRAEGCWGLVKPVIQLLEEHLPACHAQSGLSCSYEAFRNALYTAIDEFVLYQEYVEGAEAGLQRRVAQWLEEESLS